MVFGISGSIAVAATNGTFSDSVGVCGFSRTFSSFGTSSLFRFSSTLALVSGKSFFISSVGGLIVSSLICLVMFSSGSANFLGSSVELAWGSLGFGIMVSSGWLLSFNTSSSSSSESSSSSKSSSSSSSLSCSSLETSTPGSLVAPGATLLISPSVFFASVLVAGSIDRIFSSTLPVTVLLTSEATGSLGMGTSGAGGLSSLVFNSSGASGFFSSPVKLSNPPRFASN